MEKQQAYSNFGEPNTNTQGGKTQGDDNLQQLKRGHNSQYSGSFTGGDPRNSATHYQREGIKKTLGNPAVNGGGQLAQRENMVMSPNLTMTQQRVVPGRVVQNPPQQMQATGAASSKVTSSGKQKMMSPQQPIYSGGVTRQVVNSSVSKNIANMTSMVLSSVAGGGAPLLPVGSQISSYGQ